MKTTTNRRHYFLALAVSASVAAAGCNSTPGPTAPTASIAVTRSAASTVDLAACLGGSRASSCFDTGGFAPNTASGVGDSRQAAVVNSAPVSLSWTASGNTVVLAWGAPVSGDPVVTYIVEAGSGPGLTNLVSFVTGNAATSLTVPGVQDGTYYVRVRAANYSGISPPSNEVAVVVAPGPCAQPPRNLAVSSQSAGTITLGWAPPTLGSPSSYLISAGSSPGLGNVANFDTGNPGTVLTVGNVPAGSYYVRVHSVSHCGVSAPSNEVLVFVVGFTGDVQVSVSWDAPSDVDLHVVEPSGEEIYYGNPSSDTGGQLDVDSNAACSIDGRQIENIRWPGAAPAGNYVVRVDYWDSCGVARTNYLVTVRNGVATQTFTGSFTGDGDNGGAGSGVFITAFAHSPSDALRDGILRFLFRAPDLFTPSAKKMATR